MITLLATVAMLEVLNQSISTYYTSIVLDILSYILYYYSLTANPQLILINIRGCVSSTQMLLCRAGKRLRSVRPTNDSLWPEIIQRETRIAARSEGSQARRKVSNMLHPINKPVKPINDPEVTPTEVLKYLSSVGKSGVKEMKEIVQRESKKFGNVEEDISQLLQSEIDAEIKILDKRLESTNNFFTTDVLRMLDKHVVSLSEKRFKRTIYKADEIVADFRKTNNNCLFITDFDNVINKAIDEPINETTKPDLGIALQRLTQPAPTYLDPPKGIKESARTSQTHAVPPSPFLTNDNDLYSFAAFYACSPHSNEAKRKTAFVSMTVC